MGATIFYSRLFKCSIDLFNRGILLDFSKSTLNNTASSTALRSTVSEDARIEPRTVATLALSQLEAVVTRKRIKVYIEYQSVCPFVVIESPPPASKCVPPPWTQRGKEQHSLVSEGVGGPSSDNWKKD
jgi:hypothetical protein